jgi:HEPN domain-containing protein
MERLSPYTGITKIFLLAEQTITKHCSGIFTDTIHTDHCFSRYLLLVLIDETVTNKGIEDLIESRLGRLNPVSAWVMKQTEFEHALNNKNNFALKVNSTGSVLFNASNDLLFPIPSGEQCPLQPTPVEAWINRSHEFFAGATLYLLRKQIKMAAFCLHQAAEQAYTAIIFQATGFRPQTHNLTRLHQYASFFAAGLSSLFPDHIPKEECLLHRLQKAYLGARYSDNFHFPADQITILCERISELQLIAGGPDRSEKAQMGSGIYSY